MTEYSKKKGFDMQANKEVLFNTFMDKMNAVEKSIKKQGSYSEKKLKN